MIRLFVTFVVLFLTILPINADCRKVYHVPNYHYPTYHYPYPTYTAATFVQYPLILPTITVQYTGENSYANQELKQIRELLAKSMNQKITMPNQAPVQVQSTTTNNDNIPSMMVVLRDRCYKCHNERSAEGGLVIFNGDQLAPLTPEQRVKIIRDVYTGVMPKNGKCSDQEVAAVVVGISSLR